MSKFKLGNFYRIKDAHGTEAIGEYMGRQEEFGCCICYQGNHAYTFNIYGYPGETLDNVKRRYEVGSYETWGYGKEHLPEILKDYGKLEN